MAALGWLLNLGFAGGAAAAAPDVPGKEYAARDERTEYKVPAAVTQFALRSAENEYRVIE